ncbi:hypothetical protein AA0K91_18195, partial [Burkholderia multivorans]|uniref:hypothetical protein n=1 Tax=Burkholderia multivorans TaxID=87883 RepID=UPI003F7DEC8B
MLRGFFVGARRGVVNRRRTGDLALQRHAHQRRAVHAVFRAGARQTQAQETEAAAADAAAAPPHACRVTIQTPTRMTTAPIACIGRNT